MHLIFLIQEFIISERNNKCISEICRNDRGMVVHAITPASFRFVYHPLQILCM